jgi:hypothetical protein
MRTIILLLDWDSTLFWRDAEGGGRIDEATFPISDALKRRLSDYYKHYSELYFQNTGRPVPDLEKRLLDDNGLDLWQQLRAELAGVYRVLFYSDEFACEFNSPDEFITKRKEVYA